MMLRRGRENLEKRRPKGTVTAPKYHRLRYIPATRSAWPYEKTYCGRIFRDNPRLRFAISWAQVNCAACKSKKPRTRR